MANLKHFYRAKGDYLLAYRAYVATLHSRGQGVVLGLRGAKEDYGRERESHKTIFTREDLQNLRIYIIQAEQEEHHCNPQTIFV